MKKREAVNLALHISVGAALAALVCWNHWFMVSATFIYAFLREQAQHRYILTRNSGWAQGVHAVEKRTFFDFGWMTGHRLWEVFQWVIGAVVAVGIMEIVL
jgi:hypothetical protein